jgi:hypothetical protein
MVLHSPTPPVLPCLPAHLRGCNVTTLQLLLSSIEHSADGIYAPSQLI